MIVNKGYYDEMVETFSTREEASRWRGDVFRAGWSTELPIKQEDGKWRVVATRA